jgi:hypothetical protein
MTWAKGSLVGAHFVVRGLYVAESGGIYGSMQIHLEGADEAVEITFDGDSGSTSIEDGLDLDQLSRRMIAPRTGEPESKPVSPKKRRKGGGVAVDESTAATNSACGRT